MIFSFATVFRLMQIGEEAVVNDGTPMPSIDEEGGPALQGRWRARNFSGFLIDKDNPTGSLVFALPPDESGSEMVYVLYDDPALAFSFPFPSKELARLLKRQETNEVREKYEFGGAVTTFGKVDTTAISKQNISGLVQMADREIAKAEKAGVPCTFETEFTLYDNTTVTLSAEEIGQLGDEVGFHVGKVYYVSRQIKGAIEGMMANPLAEGATIMALDPAAMYAQAFPELQP